MKTRVGFTLLLTTALSAALVAVRPVAGGTADNGTFRFLTLLAPGMNYDQGSGFITGRPTVVENYHVDIAATDGITTRRSETTERYCRLRIRLRCDEDSEGN